MIGTLTDILCLNKRFCAPLIEKPMYNFILNDRDRVVT